MRFCSVQYYPTKPISPHFMVIFSFCYSPYSVHFLFPWFFQPEYLIFFSPTRYLLVSYFLSFFLTFEMFYLLKSWYREFIIFPLTSKLCGYELWFHLEHGVVRCGAVRWWWCGVCYTIIKIHKNGKKIFSDSSIKAGSA